MSFCKTIRYRAFPERRCSKASFTFDIGNTSITGATPCRTENSSMRTVLNGLPSGVPEMDFRDSADNQRRFW